MHVPLMTLAWTSSCAVPIGVPCALSTLLWMCGIEACGTSSDVIIAWLLKARSAVTNIAGNGPCRLGGSGRQGESGIFKGR